MKAQSVNNTSLYRELRAAGAREAELPELAAIAVCLRNLSHPQLQPDHQRRFWTFYRSAVLAGIAGLVVGTLLISYAQASLPDSRLYGVKRASETIATAVDPNYRATIMMRRAQEVQSLVSDHAQPVVVLGTLADYQAAAVAYAAKDRNYAVFDACKTSLQRAEAEASGAERQAIKQTLVSLKDV